MNHIDNPNVSRNNSGEYSIKEIKKKYDDLRDEYKMELYEKQQREHEFEEEYPIMARIKKQNPTSDSDMRLIK